MASLQADSFERFAATCGLHMVVEPLYSAPRDVIQEPAESDQAFLVTLDLTRGQSSPVRLIFLSPLADPTPPNCRDVLWWLAADAWAIAEADGDSERWASSYGYQVRDGATTRLYEIHVSQAQALERLVASGRYRELLALYAAEIR